MVKYSNIEPLAEGGLAELFLVELPGGQRAVLRRLQKSKVFDLKEHWAFHRGLKIRAAIGEHKNVVASLGHGYDFLQPYELIEWVNGENVKILYNSHSEILRTQPVELMLACARGLAHVHGAGFMHLDVKPENFLCSFKGHFIVKLTDFDLARPADDRGVRRQMGTPSYMAPEQIKRHVASTASDVFAFAVLAYQVFAGHLPFPGDTRKEALKNQISSSYLPRNPMDSNPGMPEKWAKAIMRGLSKGASERFPDMAAWLNEVL